MTGANKKDEFIDIWNTKNTLYGFMESVIYCYCACSVQDGGIRFGAGDRDALTLIIDLE